MVLTYDDGSTSRGKSTADADVVEGRFIRLEPGTRVVQAADFVSDNPDYAGTMILRWELAAADGATLVEITAEGVPDGISVEDHAAGLNSSLANLAEFLLR